MSKFILKNCSLKSWLCFRLFLWRIQTDTNIRNGYYSIAPLTIFRTESYYHEIAHNIPKQEKNMFLIKYVFLITFCYIFILQGCSKTYLHQRLSEGLLENFAKFTGKLLFWSHFLIKLQAYRESIASAFLWFLQNFQEHLIIKHVSNKTANC